MSTRDVAVVVRAGDDARLLLEWTTVGVHLGRARDLIRAELTEATTAAANRLGLSEDVFGALRALAVRGLHPRAWPSHAAGSLRARAISVESFEAYLRERPLADAVTTLRRLGSTEGRGDVLSGTSHVIEVLVAPSESGASSDAEWCDERQIVDAWAEGREVPSAALALALGAREGGDALRARGIVTTAWEVAPGLHMLPIRTPTIPPATHTNAFLVGDGHMILVEPASPFDDEIDRFVAIVEERRRAGMVLDAIVLTHHHPDHVGGAMAMRDRLGVPVFAHERTRGRLAGRVTIDRALVDGEVLRIEGPLGLELEMLHTPGHAPGHLAMIERRSGAMLAGDMVAGVGTILVEPYDGDMNLYLDSLRRLDARGSSMILPAHGGVVRDSHAWLSHYVAHRLAREAKIVAGLETLGGPATLDELVPVAYADTSPTAWPLARMASAAHLDKLISEGKVLRTGTTYELVRPRSASAM